MINKSASKVGTILFLNGNEVSFYIGINSNTGATIVWQKFRGIVNKFTGKSIAKLWAELASALEKGECKWIASDASCIAAFHNAAEK